MKKIILFLTTIILLSFSVQEFYESNLYGKWKIISVKNNAGSEVDSLAFNGEIFTYKKNHTIVHFNPNNPVEKEQTGKWKLVKNILYHYDDEKEMNVFGEVLKLNANEFVVVQTDKKIKTTIVYKKIK